MYKLEAQDGEARAGTLKLGKNKIKTPFWMPVGTKASVKNVNPEELKETGTQCIISNSLLLSLRPGAELIERFGGLHKYMNWHGGIFTDSGGFQIGSENFRIKVDDRGFHYKNPYSGVRELLSPEDAMKNQTKIGSDVMMALDHMPNISQDKEYVAGAVKRTHAWAERCIKWKKDNGNKKQLLFGIAQGGTFKHLREKSAEKINSLDFDGVAIGGVAIGETVPEMIKAVEIQMPYFDKNKCRYVMGVGSPTTMLEMIRHGVDCFDSIFPTQSGRRGTLYTSTGKINIRNSGFSKDFDPVDKNCKCYTCKHYSRSYLHHLLRVHEMLGYRLAALHNIHFFQNMVKNAREAIIKGEFEEFKKTINF